MAANFPPLPQIVGGHGPTYENFFRQVDPDNKGTVGAMEAANFLKKSGLKESVLSHIWDLADPGAKGFLDKTGFFVALKLIALAQNGHETSVANIQAHVPPPKMGDQSSPSMAPLGVINPSSRVGGGAMATDWVVKPQEKSKYDQIFDSLGPTDGHLSGDKVKPVLLNSKLPVDVLGRVWELSDIDQDGQLDRDEFCVAMHLVYRALENDPVPMSLPPQFIPPSKRKKQPVKLPGAVAVLPGMIPPPSITPAPALAQPITQTVGRTSPLLTGDLTGGLAPSSSSDWVVPVADRVNYDIMFKKADSDMDGLVAGLEVRDIFLNSGVSQEVLAHIWNLCDSNGVGKLNIEQFSLAMYFIQQKLKGVDPPQALTSEMMPPSMREGAANLDSKNLVGDYGAIKELDMISKEIDELKRDKILLEQDRAQKEADIKIRNGEVQSLQKELDAINNTIKQLETQKGEAQKRLDDLDDKKSKLELAVKDAKEKCEEEQREVDSLRSQITSQEMSVKNQEEELNRMKSELNSLRDEEASLERKVDAGKNQLETVMKSINDTHSMMNQVKTKTEQHKQAQKNLNLAIQQYDTLIANGDITALEPNIDVESWRATVGSSPVSSLSGFSTDTGIEDFKEDPFKNHDPFASSVSSADPFANEDPFKNVSTEDPFKGADPFSSENGFSSDPFGGNDPFKDAFGSSGSAKNDPFGGSDPFGASFPSSKPSTASNDPFDPFNDSGGGAFSTSASVKSTSGDPFGSDPFAPKPTPRKKSESPTPALPPKTKKQPPPRPAPPRAKSGSGSKKSPVTSSDPFGSDPFGSSDPFASSGGKDPFSSSGGGSDGFANFADFSPSKFSSEESQMAWATQESKKLQQRRQKQMDQEKADLELAIALSKADMGQSDA